MYFRLNCNVKGYFDIETKQMPGAEFSGVCITLQKTRQPAWGENVILESRQQDFGVEMKTWQTLLIKTKKGLIRVLAAD